ncbi:autotransporter assembly complex protein TamA [Ningiella sp. W23]|uniref:autotransporter assembly complex protein TamA n=1 Tax=Ningiella sp. W23 TaxID=3023715 RepID=UPI003757E9E9
MLGVVSKVYANVDVTIVGVQDDEIEENIRLLLHEIETPLGRINEEKYQQTLVNQALRAVHAFAYYDANIEIESLTFYEGSADKVSRDKELSFTVNVDLGSKTIIDKVVMVNDVAEINQDAIPSQITALLASVEALKGKPLNHKTYETLKNQLKTFSLLYGYFDFSFVLSKLIVQPPAINESTGSNEDIHSSATVHWIFYLGQRYRFGELSFLNETRGQELAKSVQTFEQGDYFEQSLVSTYSIDIQSTNYFSSSIARANADLASDYKVPIEVILEPKPKDTFEFGVGVSTDTGPRFTVDWSRPWVNLDGHSLGSTLYLSRPRRAVELNYRIPMANPLNDFYNFQAGYRQTDENQTESDTLSLSAHRQWGATQEDDWDKIAFLRFEQESFIQGLSEEEISTRLLLPGFTLSRTRKQGDIFVSWGDLQSITIEGGSKSLISDIDYFKIHARTKWVRELGRHRFIARADAGAIATNDFSQVPSTQRFFAGGDQSIRGFGLDEVSDFRVLERDGEAQKDLIGGRFLAVASVEYAYQVADAWRAAVFVDAGNASDDPVSDAAIGFGIGAHWLSPIGTVRIYLARGISDIPDNEQNNRIHLIIGPGL